MADPATPKPEPRADWKPLAREHARKTGRKSILDDRTPAGLAWRSEFIRRLEAGDTIANVCVVMMLHEATYHRWMVEGEERPPSDAEPTGHKARSPYREFREDVMRTRGVTRSNHILSIAAAAANDWRAAAWWLARRHPDEFSERHILAHTNPSGTGPVLVGDAVRVAAAIRDMSPDQLRALTGTGTDDLAPDPEEEGGGER